MTSTIQRSCRRQLYLQRSSDFYKALSVSPLVNRQPPNLQHPTFIDNLCSRIVTFSTATDATTTETTTTEVIDDPNHNRSKILSLYRSIRRIHDKSLPTNLRDMGNKYLQSEFRTLKDTTKMTSKHFQNFMSEWEKYRHQLLQSQNESKFGQQLPPDVQLTAEQQEQLRKLHQEVTTSSLNTRNTDSDNKLG